MEDKLKRYEKIEFLGEGQVAYVLHEIDSIRSQTQNSMTYYRHSKLWVSTPSTPAIHIKGAYTRWGVVQHRSGFGPDLALVILALVLVWLVWCVVTVL